MKIILLVLFVTLSFSLTVSLSKQCSCSVFTGETDCTSETECIWQNEACSTKTCSQFSFQKICNEQPTCSWLNDACSQFTKCSDYYVNDTFDCYLIGNDETLQWCQPVQQGNSCIDYEYQICGSTEDSCFGFTSYWTICYWISDSSSCQQIDIRECNQLISEELCYIYGEGLGCQWNNNTCSAYQCSDFTSESYCILSRQNNIQDDPQLCKWLDNQCQEANDVSHLDYSNCYTNSMYNYIWDSDNSECVSCQNYQP